LSKAQNHKNIPLKVPKNKQKVPKTRKNLSKTTKKAYKKASPQIFKPQISRKIFKKLPLTNYFENNTKIKLLNVGERLVLVSIKINK